MNRVTYIVLILVSTALVTSCGEDTEEAYQRGYDDGHYDGWAETCNEIRRFSRDIEETLEQEDIC